MTSDAMSKMNELAAKSNTLTKDLAVRLTKQTNNQTNKRNGFYRVLGFIVCVCVFVLCVGRGVQPSGRTAPPALLTTTPPSSYVCLYVRQHKQGTFVSGVAMDGKVKVTFTGTQVGPSGRICLPWFVRARGCRGVWT